MKGILQDWVAGLGLRHQGVLLAAIRGCDTAPKHDPSKRFVRAYRSVVLNAFCGDAKKAATFIECVSGEELIRRFNDFRRDLDHYPHHYVMHLIHAAEVVAYHHPDPAVSGYWQGFYVSLCVGLHMTPESKAELDARLTADETTFAAKDRV